MISRWTARGRMVRAANAVAPPGAWSWMGFERRLGRALGGVAVRRVEWDDFQCFELTGAAIWAPDKRSAVVVVPKAASLEHQIHIAGHEAWHLLERHSCGESPQAEDDAEMFAGIFGQHVSGRSGSVAQRRAHEIAAAFGMVGA